MRKSWRKNMSVADLQLAREWINTQLALGLIVPTPDGKYSAPTFFVLKGDGKSKRLVVDLRAVNAATTPLPTPILRLSEMTSELAGSQYFGSLDLVSAFWQLQMDKECQEFFTVNVAGQLYTPKRVMMGALNSTAHLHRALSTAFVDLEGVRWYVDDVLCHGETFAVYVRHLEDLLERCERYSIILSPSKSTLIDKEVTWCGMHINREGVLRQVRRDGILHATRLRTAADLSAYIGLVSYLRSQIPRLAEMLLPLHQVLRAATQRVGSAEAAKLVRVPLVEVGWDDGLDAVVARINAAANAQLRCAHPDPLQQQYLFCDASNEAAAAILLQAPKEDYSLPVLGRRYTLLGCSSFAFKPTQAHWSNTSREASSLYQGLLSFAHLLDNARTTVVYTDHRNLLALTDPKAIADPGQAAHQQMLSRWATHIRSFHLELNHLSGQENIWADMLSRTYGPAPTVLSIGIPNGDDKNDEALGQARLIFSGNVSTTSAPGFRGFNGTDLRTMAALMDPAERDPHVVLDAQGLPRWKTPGGKLWLPPAARPIALALAHNCAGHQGARPTRSLLGRAFYWPGLAEDVQAFVGLGRCVYCSLAYPNHGINREFGRPVRAMARNELLHVDYLQLDALYVLVVRDDFSAYTRLAPTDSASAPFAVATLIQWVADFGLFKGIRSDQGSHFTAEVLGELETRLHLSHYLSPVYAPWSNGYVERVNREVLRMIRILGAEQRQGPRDVPQLLPLVQLYLNHRTSPNLANLSAAQLFTGASTFNPVLVIDDLGLKLVDDHPSRQQLSEAHEALLTAIKERSLPAQEAREADREAARQRQASRARKDIFRVGQTVVVLHATSVPKTDLQWYLGTVTQVVSPHVLRVRPLADGDNGQPDAEVHVRRAVPLGPGVRPSTELFDLAAFAHATYEVESLVDFRFKAGVPYVQVAWRGFGPADNTWEPLGRLHRDVPGLTRAFLRSRLTERELAAVNKCVRGLRL